MLFFTMIEFLAVTDTFNETTVGLDVIALIPCSCFAKRQGLVRRVLFAESQITQRDRPASIAGSRFANQGIRFVRRVPAPIDDVTRIVHQPCQLHPHDPAASGATCSATLIGTPSLAARMHERDAERLNHGNA